MAPNDISSMFRTFWHDMTSNDRHAGFDSPYRTADTAAPSSSGGMGRNPAMDSISTGGRSSPYGERSAALSSSQTAGGITYNPRAPGVTSPTSPYSPGARSSSAKNDGTAISGIQLQDFAADGTPPPPPVAHSWARIDRWAEENYMELYDQLCEPATVNDINELEHLLDCSLPNDVRESMQFHDGQERGGTPTGIIFGSMLMDCEEILDEWKQWQTVISEFLQEQNSRGKQNQRLSVAGGRLNQPAGQGRAQLLSRQASQPEGAVQKVYCHPGWIPMIRDWGGNNIGIDLAPGPSGKWGQVIIFGRDYDCKYVVARSWASFLANVADDLEGHNWYVDEESGELKLKELRTNKVEPGYLDILRMRTDRKYGRRPPPGPPRRRPMPPHVATSGNGPVGPRPGSVSPGLRSPNSPMIGLTPVISRGPLPPPSKSLSPIVAPNPIKPMGKVLEEVQNDASSTSSGMRTPPSRMSLQSNRDKLASPPPIIVPDAKQAAKDDLDDLSDLISTPTTSKHPTAEEDTSSGSEESDSESDDSDSSATKPNGAATAAKKPTAEMGGVEAALEEIGLNDADGKK